MFRARAALPFGSPHQHPHFRAPGLLSAIAFIIIFFFFGIWLRPPRLGSMICTPATMLFSDDITTTPPSWFRAPKFDSFFVQGFCACAPLFFFYQLGYRIGCFSIRCSNVFSQNLHKMLSHSTIVFVGGRLCLCKYLNRLFGAPLQRF